MPKVDLNPAIKAIHGAVKDLLFREQWGHQTVCALPEYSGVLPAALQAQQPVMSSASLYWKRVKAENPALRAAYYARAKALHKPVYALVYGDFCNPPCVQDINLAGYTGRIGEKIPVRAVDDFGVREVQVLIHGADGALLESGLAAQPEKENDWWVYQTTVALQVLGGVTVEAVAVDWPGHSNRRVQLVNGGG
jgi:hypothetical protein